MIEIPKLGRYSVTLPGLGQVEATVRMGGAIDPETGDELDRAFRPIVEIPGFPATDAPDVVRSVVEGGTFLGRPEEVSN